MRPIKRNSNIKKVDLKKSGELPRITKKSLKHVSNDIFSLYNV